ncbi:hypothetical protein [Paractinoplanes toevensis]|uniref:Uncharacterized protein n=1 Tax=Paractinoplanes toevensis TaxID=571911 RepID=A0A919TK27_9ACTN|nr:hypothetical protein [Actinoplanes toevensis]GIM95684.1 hypothetical protein Ato02nite_074770 [Actinoplanes toevensis]
MANDEHAAEPSAREATDRLALALEDAGFDVGRDFPALNDAVDRDGSAVVHLGDVRPAIAGRLAALIHATALTADPVEEDRDK